MNDFILYIEFIFAGIIIITVATVFLCCMNDIKNRNEIKKDHK